MKTANRSWPARAAALALILTVQPGRAGGVFTIGLVLPAAE